jgi:uncharacterized membrane protein
MTDITRHNAKVIVKGTVATNADAAVAVVVPQVMALEGAIVTCGATGNAVAVRWSISGITLTITPSGTVGADDVYRIVAWGY